MKEGWVSDILTNCIKLKSGINLTAKQMVPGEYPVYGGNGIAGFHESWNLEGQNIIIGRVGALCGNARYVNERIWLTDNAFRISEYRYDFDLEYLTFLLNYIDLRSYARQAAQPVISNSSLEKVVLTFPKSKTEQQQIVAILDEAFAAIDQAKVNIEKNIANAKELFQSKLNAIFSQKDDGWEEKKFSELFKLKSGDGLTAKNMVNGPYPVYGGNGISGYHDTFNMDGEYLIIGRVGALCGNVRHLNEQFWLTDNAFQISEYKTDFDLEFLCLLLNYIDLRSYARQAAQPVISNSSLKDIVIPYPKELSSQRSLAENLYQLQDELVKIQNTYEFKLSELNELKKSILQKAFSGELTTKKLDVA